MSGSRWFSGQRGKCRDGANPRCKSTERKIFVLHQLEKVGEKRRRARVAKEEGGSQLLPEIQVGGIKSVIEMTNFASIIE